MTLTIVNHYTHEKTFTVVGEPNGAVKILEDSDFHLNPRVHDEHYPGPDGSQADLSSSASDEPSTPPFIEEDKSGESSDIFGRREE